MTVRLLACAGDPYRRWELTADPCSGDVAGAKTSYADGGDGEAPGEEDGLVVPARPWT
jgi:hypothetical protein